SDNPDFAPLIFDGLAASVTGPSINQPGFAIWDKAPRVAAIHRRFPNRYPLIGQDMVYYSEGRLRDTEEEE
ncbi:MAG: hypothetical protein RLZ97_1457, partial [Verrucomicrobiota bacterium]